MFISELLERCTRCGLPILMRASIHTFGDVHPNIYHCGNLQWIFVVEMAILEFNKGSSGFISVLENLSILPGHHIMIYISFILPQAA